MLQSFESSEQNSAAADFSRSSEQEGGASTETMGSSITRSSLEDSLRSIIADARDQFSSDIDIAFKFDRQDFSDLREQARSSFEDARDAFKEIKQDARAAFRSGNFSEEDLNSFSDQAREVFDNARESRLDLLFDNGDFDPTITEFDRDGAGENQDTSESTPAPIEDKPVEPDTSSEAELDSTDNETQTIVEDTSNEDTSNEDTSNEDTSIDDNTDPVAENDPTKVDPATLENTRGVVDVEEDFAARLGDNGDVLDPGGGVNTVVGANGNDVIFGNRAEAFNTISTGDGEDLIVLGATATNRIFDFDPTLDKFGLTGDISFDNIIFGQGTNPQNGGLDQPLDSRNNTVLLDKDSQQILASLTFVSADSLSSSNFVTVDPVALEALLSPPGAPA